MFELVSGGFVLCRFDLFVLVLMLVCFGGLVSLIRVGCYGRFVIGFGFVVWVLAWMWLVGWYTGCVGFLVLLLCGLVMCCVVFTFWLFWVGFVFCVCFWCL